MIKFDQLELGKSDEVHRFDSIAHHKMGALGMLKQGRRTVEIISRSLDPLVYDDLELIDAIKYLVLGNKRASVRILVFEPKKIVSRSHRLVDLAMVLSDFIKIRKPDEQYKDYNEELLLVDRIGYIHRLNGERYEGTANFRDPALSKLLLEQFNEIWAHSTPDPNFRRMAI